ncbi:MAG: heavy-metal-associated domain-containing protein [Vicinamibacteraceae bacterium]
MRVTFVGWSIAAAVTAAVTVLLIGGASGRASVSGGPASGDTGREAIVSVNGLSCSMCAQHLDSRLRKLPAVDNVKVDLEKQTATLSLTPDGDLTDDQITEAVRDAGFNVRRIERRGESHAASSNTTTAAFKVDGMDCSRCAAHLARVLQEEPGVEAACVDFDTKLAVVHYDAKNTTAEQIEKAIEDSGVFRAELVSGSITKDKP